METKTTNGLTAVTVCVVRRSTDLWKVAQTEGEKSYSEDGPVGNFSHDEWKPAAEAARHLTNVAQNCALVLDIGCGQLPTPVYMGVLQTAWTGVTNIGIDPASQDRAVYAERTFPSARSFGEHLPFRNKVFDAVMFVSSIDHMINPRHALIEARRVLRPGGWLLVEETCRAVDLGYIKWLVHSHLGRLPYRYNRFHNWAYTERSLMQLIRHAGFNIVRNLRSDIEPKEAIIIAQVPTQ